MRNLVFGFVTLCGLGLMGCGNGDVDTADETPSGQVSLVSGNVLCGKCGNDKSDSCCLEVGETCASCNLEKGSTLCCKLSADQAGKDYCKKCGQEAGSESCCKEGAEKCEKCGLHAGSALCCKLAASEE